MAGAGISSAGPLDGLRDIAQMFYVAFGWQKPGHVMAGNIVPTEMSLSKPETLLPLFIGVVVQFINIRLIEFLGRIVGRFCRLKAKKLESFTSAWLEAVYFGGQIFISYRLFSGFDWFWPSGWTSSMDDGRKGAANGLNGVPPFHCTRDFRGYYIFEFGYYAASLVLIFSKKRKKDFLEMVFHHVVTSFLISLSYANWHLRIGVIVMMIHNAFDPWLNVAKMANYAFKKSSPLHLIADVTFGIGAITFLATRLILYPYAIYHAWMYASPHGVYPIWGATLEEWVLKLLLCFLYPVHVYWFVLIVKVAQRALLSGTVQKDERSSSDEASDASPKNKKSE